MPGLGAVPRLRGTAKLKLAQLYGSVRANEREGG